MGSTTASDRAWWKDGVVYQIYPSSFFDSNNDGLGDVPGIISKVDYLKDLGIDIVWVSPMFKSPMVDNGYDISDYEAVHEPFGTVDDMKALIQACHARGMRLILDLVVNHTSDQHAWFQESRSSKDNPKRDWYIWKPPRYDETTGERLPPTNWRSYFSGGTWEWDERTGEYYLHLFAKEQPDLNWENPEVREAIYQSAMRFWLDLGVDGFRIDTVNMYSKAGYSDAPVLNAAAYEQPAWMMYCNGPRMHEYLREMNDKVLNHYDVMTVGELPHTPDPAHVLRYVRSGDKQLNMVFQFDIVDIGQGSPYKYRFQPWKLPVLKNIVAKWQGFIDGTDGWTTVFCENHDQGRSVSRFASDAPEYRALSAKMLALMMCSLTGTLFVYQGQEIGMINAPRSWTIDDYKDIESLKYYNTVLEATSSDAEGREQELKYVMDSINLLGRDNARLPMQWDSSPNAGFTTSKTPWIRVHDLYPEINVARQQGDPHSVLSFWKGMIKLRKEHGELLTHGAFSMLEPEHEQVFVFTKTKQGEGEALVMLNFSGGQEEVTLPERQFQLMVGNYEDVKEADAQQSGPTRTLRPWEGRLYLKI